MRKKVLHWSDPQSEYSLSEKAGKIAMLFHTPSIVILWILVLAFRDQLYEAGIRYGTWKFWLMGWGIMILPYYAYKVFIRQILNVVEED